MFSLRTAQKRPQDSVYQSHVLRQLCAMSLRGTLFKRLSVPFLVEIVRLQETLLPDLAQISREVAFTVLPMETLWRSRTIALQ